MGSAPYMPLYLGDWFAATASLPLEVRGAWITTIGFMWQETSATLTEKSAERWARRWGCVGEHDPERILEYLEDVATVTRHEDGSISIHSKRVESELAVLEEKREAGRERKRRWASKKSDSNDGNALPTRSERVSNTGGTDTDAFRTRLDIPIPISLKEEGEEERRESVREKREEGGDPVQMWKSATGYDPAIVHRTQIEFEVKRLDVWESVIARFKHEGYRSSNIAVALKLYREEMESLTGAKKSIPNKVVERREEAPLVNPAGVVSLSGQSRRRRNDGSGR